MPAIDHCQPAVIRALEKAGWHVTHQPYPIIRHRRRKYLFVDLRLERRESGGGAIVVVEIKCFYNRHVFLSDFYQAVGQYVMYRNALRISGVDVPVYLALPLLAYERSFQDEVLQSVMKDIGLHLVVVDLEGEEVVQWIVSEG